MGTMEETIATFEEWKLQEAMRMSLEEDIDDEADYPMPKAPTMELSYASICADTGKASSPVVDTSKLIEPLTFLWH